jgi:hypothetical protein
MRITIEINTKNEMEKISALFKTFKINRVNVISGNEDNIAITKGDKQIDPQNLFGIWSKKPRSIESIRKDAWQRDGNIG